MSAAVIANSPAGQDLIQLGTKVIEFTLLVGVGVVVYEIIVNVENIEAFFQDPWGWIKKHLFSIGASPCDDPTWYSWLSPIGAINNAINKAKCKKIKKALEQQKENDEKAAEYYETEDNIQTEVQEEEKTIDEDFPDGLDPATKETASVMFAEYDEYLKTNSLINLSKALYLRAFMTPDEFWAIYPSFRNRLDTMAATFKKEYAMRHDEFNEVIYARYRFLEAMVLMQFLI